MPDTTPPAVFLAADAVIDFGDPALQTLARSLARATALDTARACYEWVRDQIEHSFDYRRQELPLSASQVLAVGTGLCIAKSHLLVALWRWHGIPGGFCYQRLILDEPDGPFCTHVLTAVWLADRGWYRCDARGNRHPDVRCTFTPGSENLAYPITVAGECLHAGVWAAPWPQLVDAMLVRQSIADYRAAPIDILSFPPCDVALPLTGPDSCRDATVAHG